MPQRDTARYAIVIKKWQSFRLSYVLCAPLFVQLYLDLCYLCSLFRLLCVLNRRNGQ